MKSSSLKPMTACYKRLLPAAALVVIALVLTGCQMVPTVGSDNTRWYCEGFRPITWSARDTTETINQIVEHNAVWESLCNWQKPEK
ncbi:MAG: hypothetical protein ACR2O3_10425 [Rhizobiaceae bacterium]